MLGRTNIGPVKNGLNATQEKRLRNGMERKQTCARDFPDVEICPELNDYDDDNGDDSDDDDGDGDDDDNGDDEGQDAG